MYINKNKKIQSHHMCRKKHQIRNRFAIASILSGILDSVWQAHALKILAQCARYDLGARRLINARAELCRRVVSLMRWFRICSLTLLASRAINDRTFGKSAAGAEEKVH